MSGEMKLCNHPLLEQKNRSIHAGHRITVFSGFVRTASRKLDQLDAATALADLARPRKPLEAIKGRGKIQWSILINNQWRICFKWVRDGTGPTDIGVVGCH